MKSELPKVLHPVGGVPMVDLVGRAMRAAGVDRLVVVIGHGAEQVRETFGDRYDYAVQDPPRGTGDAVRVALEALGPWDGPVVVSSGDTPLITGEALKELVDRQAETGAGAVVATFCLDDPAGYGRVLTDGQDVLSIVEHKDATPEQRAVREVNASVYCFDGALLAGAIPRIGTSNSQGEYYLTDAVGILRGDGAKVVVQRYDDPELFAGVNDRWQLAQSEKALRTRINRQHALNGVTLIDPDSIYIGVDVVIGRDSVIEPQTFLVGETAIGERCQIGPCTKIKNTRIGDGCYVYMAHVNDAEIGDGVKIGPYANIRPGSVLAEKVKIGNFVETKNAQLGVGVAASHLSYLGDATIGAGTNIGAGTITVNYDGVKKYRTTIGEKAFIGSNSTLIAPRNIGDRAFVVAGSVITEDVPEDAGAFGRARQETKPGWAARWRQKRSEQTP